MSINNTFVNNTISIPDSKSVSMLINRLKSLQSARFRAIMLVLTIICLLLLQSCKSCKCPAYSDINSAKYNNQERTLMHPFAITDQSTAKYRIILNEPEAHKIMANLNQKSAFSPDWIKYGSHKTEL